MQVHVRRTGDGDPLLMLMGVGGHLGLWAPLARHLPGRSLVSFDFSGTGGSSLPRFPPTIPSYACFVRRLMDRCRIRPGQDP
jgi:pimeloyl-ACP methyl ester carboxylesterase